MHIRDEAGNRIYNLMYPNRLDTWCIYGIACPDFLAGIFEINNKHAIVFVHNSDRIVVVKSEDKIEVLK